MLWDRTKEIYSTRPKIPRFHAAEYSLQAQSARPPFQCIGRTCRKIICLAKMSANTCFPFMRVNIHAMPKILASDKISKTLRENFGSFSMVAKTL